MFEVDPIFQEHIDKMKALHEELKADIEKSFNELSLDDILRNPESELIIFSEEVSSLLIKKYSTKFIAEGVRFADKVKNTKRLIAETVVTSSSDSKEAA